MKRYLVIALFVAAVLTLGASGCRSLSGSDLDKVREHRAIFAAHAADESLPQEAREIAADAVDTLWLVDYKASGTRPPDEVLGRIGGGGDDD